MISVFLRDISFIDLSMSDVPIACCTCDEDDPVAEVSLDVIDTAVVNTPFGAKCSASVEGTIVLTVVITVGIET